MLPRRLSQGECKVAGIADSSFLRGTPSPLIRYAGKGGIPAVTSLLQGLTSPSLPGCLDTQGEGRHPAAGGMRGGVTPPDRATLLLPCPITAFALTSVEIGRT